MALDAPADAPAAADVPGRGRAPAPLDESLLSHLVGYRLAKARVPAQRVYRRHVGTPLALRPAEFSLLQMLLVSGSATPSQLALSLDVTPPKVTALVDRLVERGLARRQRSAVDGRGFDVLLTDAGRALAQRAQRLAQTMESAWLAQALTPAERAMLLELLGKLARG